MKYILKSIFGIGNIKGYDIHEGANHIGTSNAMDIIIDNDTQVTRDNHCIIFLNGNRLEIQPCTGSLTYVNNVLINTKTSLKESDVIRIGQGDFQICKIDT